MWFERMTLEVWFDRYQYEVDYDIGESAVKWSTFDQLGVSLDGLPLRYGYHHGLPALREAIADQFPGLDSSNVCVTNGASEANFCLISGLLKPGEHIIVEHPNYSSNYEAARSLGCDVELFTLAFEDSFRPDIDRLKRMIRPDTKLVSLTHPNNPTGSMVTEDELHEIIRIVENAGTYLLFDETYRDLAFDATLPPAATLSDRVISMSSMSKVYGIPGIRIGWVATQDMDIIDQMVTIREQITITNNVMSERIATEVLGRRDELLAKSSTHVAGNRDIVAEWMNGQEWFEWVYPEAGVVAFPRLKADVPVDPDELFRRLAEEYRTFTVPGRFFEMDSRHFRLGFGANPDEITTGLDNLAAAVRDLLD